MCSLLKDNFDVQGEKLLRLWKLNLIPKEGSIANEIKYNFHGGGCYFEFENGTIDIDFGPDGRCDGVDPYKLYDFLETTNHKRHVDLLDKRRFFDLFNQLIEKKYIVCPGWYPNPSLYYLKMTSH